MTEAQWRRLGAAARVASGHAYCPYSGFAVGAAVLTADGSVVSGCNVENASFGLTVCAERNAVFRAVIEGARTIAAVLIYTPTPDPVTPCGACRQVIAEFGPEARVRSLCTGPGVLDFTIGELLPHGFAFHASGSGRGT